MIATQVLKLKSIFIFLNFLRDQKVELGLGLVKMGEN